MEQGDCCSSLSLLTISHLFSPFHSITILFSLLNSISLLFSPSVTFSLLFSPVQFISNLFSPLLSSPLLFSPFLSFSYLFSPLFSSPLLSPFLFSSLLFSSLLCSLLSSLTIIINGSLFHSSLCSTSLFPFFVNFLPRRLYLFTYICRGDKLKYHAVQDLRGPDQLSWAVTRSRTIATTSAY